jgi:predicted nucleic acid-binding protein
MKFLDTNVIIRYLTKDDPDKAARAYHFLLDVEKGKEQVQTSEAVIAEVVHVLSSKRMYNYPRLDVVKKLLPVLQLKGLQIESKKMYTEALTIYAQTTIDFVDALIVAKMHHAGIETLVSFDHDFDDFPFIKREEPKLRNKVIMVRNLGSKEKWKAGNPTLIVAVQRENNEWEAYANHPVWKWSEREMNVQVTNPEDLVQDGVKLTLEEAEDFFPNLDIAKYKK